MELWHETAGDGPPLLFVHAGACDSGMWDAQWGVDAYAAAHTVVRCDLRGFGRTPILPEPYAPAGDLAELLDRLALGPAAVVGSSFGGLVTLDLALARPDLVTRLVVAGAPLPGGEASPELSAFAEAEDTALETGDLDAAVEANLRTWIDAGRDPAELPPGMRERVGEMQRRAFELQLPVAETAEDGLLNEDLDDRLAEIAAPTLAIVGELDLPDFHRYAERIAAAVPASRLETIAGAAHLPSMERPAEFDRLTLEFLADPR